MVREDRRKDGKVNSINSAAETRRPNILSSRRRKITKRLCNLVSM
jgi:hypothetical protein